MTGKEYAQEYRRKRTEKGICVMSGCNSVLDRKGVYCSKCAEKLKKYCKETRAFYQNIGICPNCKKNVIMGQEKTCPECRAVATEKASAYRKENSEEYKVYQKEYQKKKTEQCRERGICPRCKKRKSEKGKKHCSYCLEKLRGYQRKRYEKAGHISREYARENSLCYFCGNPVVEHLKVCEKCRDRLKGIASSENAVKARQKMKEEGRGFYKAI